MLRRILLMLLVPVLVLSACGDAGLNAQGLVEVTTTDGTARRFAFPNQTRLDGTSPGRFTGTCDLRRMRDAEGNEHWGTIVVIHSGGLAEDDFPLTSVTIMQNTGSAPEGGRMEIALGGATYTQVDGECTVEMPYALADGVVGLEGTCRVLDDSNNAADVSFELDLAGCAVEL